jgi:transposase
MCGTDTQQSARFSYLSAEDRVPADHPLRAVRVLTDRILSQLSTLFSAMYSKMGRPSIPPEKLLRALLLQILYTAPQHRRVQVKLRISG